MLDQLNVVSVHLFLETAAHIVIAHLDLHVIVLRYNQTVFPIPSVGPAVPGQHVAVCVVGRLHRVDYCVLVQQVVGVGPVHRTLTRRRAVADSVVVVGKIGVVADGLDQLALAVVSETPCTAVGVFRRRPLVFVVQRVSHFSHAVELDFGQAVAGVILVASAVQRRILRIAPLCRQKLVHTGTVSVVERVGTVPERSNPAQ
ncbi:hypothetical protein SDC9_181757 [bioreactor metagenome]|uniref:Uncharacterized protein n=1 Tax=bioreactor metagenome TaxID=1076179 RepID=A0A645HDU2_9ZZZZ